MRRVFRARWIIRHCGDTKRQRCVKKKVLFTRRHLCTNLRRLSRFCAAAAGENHGSVGEPAASVDCLYRRQICPTVEMVLKLQISSRASGAPWVMKYNFCGYDQFPPERFPSFHHPALQLRKNHIGQVAGGAETFLQKLQQQSTAAHALASTGW